MATPSKEEQVLKLLLENSPLREWHFGEIVREAKVTKAVANKWLKKYVREGLLKRGKVKGRFPHFTAGAQNPVYQSFKRVYALTQLHRCGLIPKLLSLNEAKTVILFGSSVKGDWYKGSDIDIFILGNIPDFERNIYERRLGKHIELHMFQDTIEIREVKTGLMKNVMKGYVVKGQIQDIVEVA